MAGDTDPAGTDSAPDADESVDANEAADTGGSTEAEEVIAGLPDDVAAVVFDGVCNLCTGTVQFIIPRDPDAEFRFAPLQSDVGAALYERCGEDADIPQTFVVIEDGECYRKSGAAIRIGERLGGIYRVASLGRAIPGPVRDRLYDLVATNRYSIFGKRERCMVPTPDVESRFLALTPVGDGE